jgi:hypothetical protein
MTSSFQGRLDDVEEHQLLFLWFLSGRVVRVRMPEREGEPSRRLSMW